MNLLAIETAVAPGSLALRNGSGEAEGGFAVELPPQQRTAQSLAPAIKRLLDDAGVEAKQLDAVAVTTGPGSFTGLRIGVTAAKTLAYAAGATCMPINTLAVLAAQAGAGSSQGWAVLDAQRQELFAAPFAGDRLTGGTVIVGVSDWLAQLQSGDHVVGPVLSGLRNRLPAGVEPAPESAWRPRAETVARLAAETLAAGRSVTPFELLPEYHRLSAAEEKLQQAGGDD